MKKLLLANALLVFAVIWTGWRLSREITSVAQAKPVTKWEIFVEMDDGSLVAYNRVKILPIPKPSPKSTNRYLREQVYRQYVLYRRFGTGNRYLERTRQYDSIINQAAKYLGLDPDLGRGLIAVESMGLPDIVSSENAVGLTQILVVPKICENQAKRILGVNEINRYDPVQNVWVGLITLKHYTQQKDNNLMLGLVSYNFGPNRRSVQQASSWYDLQVTDKIKAYPVKVLALALMAKVKKEHGKVLPYNAQTRAKFEAIDLPGL